MCRLCYTSFQVLVFFLSVLRGEGTESGGGGTIGRRRQGKVRRGPGRKRRIREDVRLQLAPPDYQQEAAAAVRPEKLRSSFRSSSFSEILNTIITNAQKLLGSVWRYLHILAVPVAHTHLWDQF